MKRTTAILALALACAGPAWAQADSYPIRPIRLVVGFAPGGAASPP